jgi:hypothetical protein
LNINRHAAPIFIEGLICLLSLITDSANKFVSRRVLLQSHAGGAIALNNIRLSAYQLQRVFATTMAGFLIRMIGIHTKQQPCSSRY